MLKFKKLIPVAFLMVIFFACTREKKVKTPLQIKLDELDTLFLITNQSDLKIERFRKFNHASEMVRVGKMNFRLTANDLNIHSLAEYKIDSGYIIYNKKTFTSKCYIKTSQIVTPILDSAKQLTIGTPGYLNKKTSEIIFEFKGNFFPADQAPTAAVFLTLGDTTGILPSVSPTIQTTYGLKKTRIKSMNTKFNLNGLEWNLFEPENKNEIEKDSIIGNLKLIFE